MIAPSSAQSTAAPAVQVGQGLAAIGAGVFLLALPWLVQQGKVLHPAVSNWSAWQTVQALGITAALYRTLRTTNPIENLNGSVAYYCRNVKRWGDGQMVLRWVASALSDAATRMRKLRGCGQMRTLLKALDGRRPESDNGAVLKAA